MFFLSDVTSFLPELLPPRPEGATHDGPRGTGVGGVLDDEHALILGLDGVDYRIPTLDDEESATFADEDGMSILADTDGDGRVDYVSNVTFDGQWSAWKWQAPQENAVLPQDGVQSGDSVAPECGAENWDAERWICVERGEWG